MIIPESQLNNLFERARVGITVAGRNEYIKSSILPFGIDEARLAYGQTLLDDARDKVKTQQDMYAIQKGLTDNLVKKKREAKTRSMLFAKNLKRELRGDIHALDKLGLNSRRLSSFDGFIEQSRQMYSNAINDTEIFARIQPVVGTVENLQAGWDLVNEVEELNTDQEEAKGAAQRATVEKDEAIAALAKYMYYFTDACRIALGDKPQLLEKLKIRAYSKNYLKRKAAASEEPPVEDPPTQDPPPGEEPATNP